MERARKQEEAQIDLSVESDALFQGIDLSPYGL